MTVAAPRRGLGYLHRPPSLRARLTSAARATRVPADFEPTAHPPFPELYQRIGAMDQGVLNACTGYGLAMGAMLQEAAAGFRRFAALSPRVPYWAARRREVGADELVEDQGAFVDDVVWAFNHFGASEVELGTEQARAPLSSELVNDRPPPAEFRQALRVRSQLRLRMRSIVASGDRLVQRLTHSLHQRQVGFVALPVGDSFYDPPPVIPAQRDHYGYHFVCVLDWRRRATGGYELLCGNSWGWGWGVLGTAWLSPELVKQTLGAWYLELEGVGIT